MKRLLGLSAWLILVLCAWAWLPALPAEKTIFVFSGYYFFYGMILEFERQEDGEQWRFLIPKTILGGIIWPFILIGLVFDIWLENLDTGLNIAFA